MPLFLALSILNVTLASIIFEAFGIFGSSLIRFEVFVFTVIYGFFEYKKHRSNKRVHTIKRFQDFPVVTAIKKKTLSSFLLWILNFCACVIIVFQIWSVHFNYSGEVLFEKGYSTVKNAQIPTPFYSDEWLVASYINKIVDTGKLPMVNPLTKDRPYPNTLLGFYSFVAGVSVLFGLDPVFDFGYLYMIVLMLFSVALYICIKSIISKHRQSSTIALLGVSTSFLIANSGSFPGLWTLIPAIGGIIFLLLQIAALHNRDVALEYISVIGVIIVYPPLIVLALPLLYFYDEIISKKYIYAGLASVAVIISILVTTGGHTAESVYTMLYRFLFRWVAGSSDYVIVPTTLLPVIVLFFTLYGIYVVVNKRPQFELRSFVKFFLYVFLFWFLGTFFSREFVIGYPRATLVASILLIIFACIAVDDIYLKIKGKMSDILFRDLLVAIMLIFPTFMFTWGLEVPHRPLHAQRFIDEDIQNFQYIKDARFISPKWKGLVLGVITPNYPLYSKESIVAVNILGYEHFMAANCGEKIIIARKKKIDYAYSNRPINCYGFVQTGFTTTEGFRLYNIYK